MILIMMRPWNTQVRIFFSFPVLISTLYSISLGSRQGRSRHRVAVRSPRRHQYAWKPILLGGLDIANCTAGMAALFHMVDRASAPPNPAADVGAWVGYFSSMHGRLQRFRLPTRWPVLPGPLRSRLSSPFQRNYESMVPSCRAAYSSGYLVFNKRGCNYHGVGAGIWFEPYSIRYPEALADVSFNSLSFVISPIHLWNLVRIFNVKKSNGSVKNLPFHGLGYNREFAVGILETG